MNDVLQQAKAAAEAGRREEARDLLVQLVDADERNAAAWFCLSSLVDDPDDIKLCLENVLALDPEHADARAALAKLHTVAGRDTQTEVVHTRVAEQAAAPSEQVPVANSITPTPEAPATTTPTTSNAPCVYCGALNALTQEFCVHCQKSLLVRVPASSARSLELTLLAILSGIGSVFTILAGVLLFVAGLVFKTGIETLRQQPGGLEQGLANVPASANLPLQMDIYRFIDLVGSIVYGIALLFVIGGVCYLLVTRGLWRRQRWAFFVAVVFSVFGALSSLASILLAVAARDISISTVISIIIQIVMIALTVASYRDLFGPKVRIQPKVEATHAAGHYKNGLAYKQRGMWYMVVKEWEAALAQAPTNVQYLHALGLAYAQIKQFNQSRAVLDQALELAPADAHIKDSRALVERMANAA